jgi:hypothetical protein
MRDEEWKRIQELLSANKRLIDSMSSSAQIFEAARQSHELISKSFGGLDHSSLALLLKQQEVWRLAAEPLRQIKLPGSDIARAMDELRQNSMIAGVRAAQHEGFVPLAHEFRKAIDDSRRAIEAMMPRDILRPFLSEFEKAKKLIEQPEWAVFAEDFARRVTADPSVAWNVFDELEHFAQTIPPPPSQRGIAAWQQVGRGISSIRTEHRPVDRDHRFIYRAGRVVRRKARFASHVGDQRSGG